MMLRSAHWRLWMLVCVMVGMLFVLYASASQHTGTWLMPLDDVYIHFQYAKQAALGQPYVYNEGLPPSSGATSFAYPFLLALGYSLGAQGLALGAWAMSLGALALIAAAWGVRRVALAWSAEAWTADFSALALLLSGGVAWHFFSGMETGLVLALALWTLATFQAQQVRWFALCASALALLRPEASALAASAAVLMAWRVRGEGWRSFSWAWVPMLMLGVQPVVNWLITGTLIASGNQAKSILGMIPPNLEVMLTRILENAVRMWAEALSGMGYEGAYWTVALVPLGLLGYLALLVRPKTRASALLLLAWALILTASVSTLDNAFWHYKRYQMPLVLLFMPLLALALSYAPRFAPHMGKLAVRGYAVLALASGMLLTGQFLLYHAYNVRLVYEQPYKMANWLKVNTAPESRVAVHDVGMMRYIGERTTLDMVGLTTSGAAQAWRNGVGSVAEWLFIQRPDYIASYGRGHGYGLYMLEEAGLYAPVQATFEVLALLPYNVALAGTKQGIYAPDWATVRLHQAEPVQIEAGMPSDAEILDSLNVAQVDDETAHAYQWTPAADWTGFASGVSRFPAFACDCDIIDAWRTVTRESFTLMPEQGGAVWLVTRLNVRGAGRLAIWLNGEYIAERVLPDLQGRWLELVTPLPEGLEGKLNLELRASAGVSYQPARHWLVRAPQITLRDSVPLAAYQAGALNLLGANFELEQGTLQLDWQVQGIPEGDYRLFVHVVADLNAPPLAQADAYLGAGAVPVGNLWQGLWQERLRLDLSALPAGEYQVLVGFYDPVSNVRLMPSSDTLATVEDGRLVVARFSQP